MIKIWGIITVFVPSWLLACGPTLEDLKIFLAFVLGIISLFIWSLYRLKKGKSKWYLIGLVPLLSFVLLIAYTYVAQETDWLDKKSHNQTELHPWKVELNKESFVGAR